MDIKFQLVRWKPFLFQKGTYQLKTYGNDDDASYYLSFRISPAFPKWKKLKHFLTDKRIVIFTQVKFLGACDRLLYSCQSWELAASELIKLETFWNDFLRKILIMGYKHKKYPTLNMWKLEESKDVWSQSSRTGWA